MRLNLKGDQRKMKLKAIMVMFIGLNFSILVNAQVTIGSEKEPDASSLLDIKNQSDNTSSKGILFPRVVIPDTTQFGLEGDSKTAGTVVYNTVDAIKNSGKGLYYWNGSCWVHLKGNDNRQDWLTGGNTNGVLKTLGTKDNFDLPFITQGSEKMRITAAGNVGVGTSTPKSKFSVSGGPLSQDDYADGDKFLFFGYPEGPKINVASGGGLQFYAGATVQSDGVTPNNLNCGNFSWNVADADNTWREVMRMTNGGNLGIGTKNPGSNQLDVAGDAILEGALTLQTTPGSTTTSKVVTVGADGTVKKSNISVPQIYAYQLSVQAGKADSVMVSDLGSYNSFTVYAENSCNDISTATFDSYFATLSFVSGMAKGVPYSYTLEVDPYRINLTASISPCASGGSDQFNYAVESKKAGGITYFKITNKGTTDMVYKITEIKY